MASGAAARTFEVGEAGDDAAGDDFEDAADELFGFFGVAAVDEAASCAAARANMQLSSIRWWVSNSRG